jgi:hypothetical protein
MFLPSMVRKMRAHRETEDQSRKPMGKTETCPFCFQPLKPGLGNEWRKGCLNPECVNFVEKANPRREGSSHFS